MKPTSGSSLPGSSRRSLVVVFVGYMVTEAIRPAALRRRSPTGGPVGVARRALLRASPRSPSSARRASPSPATSSTRRIGLLIALLGAGSLYVFLAADFVAVTQLLIYIGGVLVLILFAVMLTNRIAEVNVSNSSLGLFGGVLLFVAVAAGAPRGRGAHALAARARARRCPRRPPRSATRFLTRWLLPFEVASLVLLATLIGAVVIARKEIKAD